MITFIVTSAVVFLGVAMRDELGASTLGLSIVYVISLSGLFQWVVRQSAEVENQMVSVERMAEYTELPQEETAAGDAEEPPPEWPTAGEIRFQRYSLRYGEDEPDVLKELTLAIHAGEKTGIVGRTGAGKSSLVAALFRLAPNTSGRILIDDVDIDDVPLDRLRAAISVIPQEPVLYSGTVRLNVDPFGRCTDDAIWSAIEDVQLKDQLGAAGLATPVTENGANFSTGERQLITLARALLQPNRILILDEATANIDQATDATIQRIIRERFADWTVLTVAHRLNTVQDSDRVLVLDAGRIVEHDAPSALLARRDSRFSMLARHSRGSSRIGP